MRNSKIITYDETAYKFSATRLIFGSCGERRATDIEKNISAFGPSGV